MIRIILALAAFILIIVSFTACKGSPGDPGSVSAQYSSAVVAKDWELVCNLISQKSQRAVIRESGEDTCPEAYLALPEAGQETLQQSAQGAEFVSEEIEGDQGIVTLRTDAGTAKVPVIREDGEWRVHLFRD